ncbi:hypothetical protein LguiB_015608 [Lonicera macranthoides]
MGTTPLRQFLQSLCCNSRWNYAVFWKLHPQTPMLLTWEDGYCDTSERRESVESILDNNCSKGSDEMLPSNGESSIYDANLGGYPIELAVAYMSSAQYALGDGVVGEVAYTGNYSWVFSDNISGGEFDSNLLSECPDEWLFQFAAGIKTLLLVPVVPHGVLQFGSFEMVAEDPALVAYIKDKFITYQNFVSYSVPSTENRESSLKSTFMENLDEVSALTVNEMKPGDSNAVNSFKSVQHRFSTMNQSTPQCPILCFENDISAQLTGFVEASELPFQLLNCNNLETMESSSFKFSAEDLLAFSYSNEYNSEVLEQYLDGTMKSYSVEDANYTGYTNTTHFFSFPGDCELHKALGPAFMPQTNELKPSVSNGDLLKAVDANIYCVPDESLSKTASSEKSSMTSSGQLLAASSKGEKGQSERTFMFGKGRNVPISTSSPSVSSSAMNALIVEDQKQKENGYSNLRKGSKLSNASKRRPRAGDNQRPRPRDRQLIQDRVKELRELVPNGAKCSIDGLLDRTVNHMLFLRNVTDQADKLRQSVHHDVAGPNNMKSHVTNGGQQSGTSWAFELGSEQQICPIVIEDLECPGHMLIELMCNDHWHFLEIADVIHRLELTILKGAMESHSDNTWAHFIIEAPRGFHRLDIFWPLMRLLPQNQNPISSKI